MSDFDPLVPLLNPFLDDECRALLLVLCKAIRQTHWDLLQPKLPPKILAKVEEAVAVLHGARLIEGQPHYVTMRDVGLTTSFALALYYRCLDTIGVDLRFLVSNLSPTNSFAIVKNRFKG